ARFGSLDAGPDGIAVDSSRNLYVADTGNNTIRLGRLAVLMQYSLSGNQLLLSWPVAASNFVLETSSTLTPGAIWTPLTNGMAVFGDSFVRTNSLTTPTAFYRLHKP